jgi:hypothetical protein
MMKKILFKKVTMSNSSSEIVSSKIKKTTPQRRF